MIELVQPSAFPKIIAEPQTADVHRRTLGVEVVVAQNNADTSVINAGSYAVAAENASGRKDKFLRDEMGRLAASSADKALDAYAAVDEGIDDFRKSLIELNETGEEVVEAFCKRLPGFIQAAKAKQAPEISWAKWLTQELTDEETPDLRLINLLQFHVYTLGERQKDPEVQAAIEREQELYKKGVLEGVEEGWLDESAVVEAEARVEAVPVYIGDVFDTLCQSNHAYYNWLFGEVVIGNLDELEHHKDVETNTLQNIADTAAHEFNHAVFGGIFRRFEWFYEAITEHMALVMRHGQLETLRPKERRGNSIFYEEQRQLVAELFKSGDKEIPVRLATQAYSATGFRKRELIGRLKNELEAAWGRYVDIGSEKSVLELVEERVSMLTDELGDNKDAKFLAAEQVSKELANNPEIVFSERAREFPPAVVV